MRFALTGVPGVGKTTLAKALAARGVRVVHLNEFAAEHGLLGEPDAAHHDAREVDLDALQDALDAALGDEAGPVVYEGHFAHDMDVDGVVLLRCDPLVLVERLRARGWPEAKVRENVEAEALDIIAGEVAESGIPACELDLTGLSVDESADRIRAIVDNAPEAFKEGSVGRVAWVLESLPWF